MRAVLGNVEEMIREYPGFEAPPAEYREGLQPGDLAELMFLSDQAPRGHWAEVTEVPQPGWYRGILDTGEWIDFGPEHVADVKMPSPQMGVIPFGYFGSGKMPEKKPSIWDWEDRALWVEAQKKKEEAERAAKGLPPKRSFWDWLRRKKTAPEVAPIPETERRAPSVPRGLLPAPVEIFEEPSAPPPPRRPGPPPPEREPQAPPPIPTIIVPPAPPRPNPGAIMVPEESIQHEAPVSYFDVLGPSTEEAPPAPKEERGIILLSPGPGAPSTGLVSAAPSDVFSVLAPGPVEPSPSAGGLIVPEEGPRVPAVAQADVFEILAPAAAPTELTPFDVLGPAGGMVVAPPSAPATPFDVLVPSGEMMVAPPPGEITPFDVLTPAGGMVVAPPVTPFDVLAPEAPGGLTPYAPPQELSPFEVVGPPPGSAGWGGWGTIATPAEEVSEEEAEEEEPEGKLRKKNKVAKEMSLKSTWQDWAEWFKYNFYVDNFRNYIRSDVEDPEFRNQMARDAMYSDEPPSINLIMHQYGDWETLFSEFDIPYEEIEPWIEKIGKKEEEVGGHDIVYERFTEQVIDSLGKKLNKAIKSVYPRNTFKGNFFFEEDRVYESGSFGLIYYERMSQEEAQEILEEEERQERIEVEKAEAREAGKKKRFDRMAKVFGKKSLDSEDLLPWVKATFNKDFWNWLRDKLKTKGWEKEKRQAARENDMATMEIQVIGQEGKDLEEQIMEYFGIPPEILEIYLGSLGDVDEARDALWGEVLQPWINKVEDLVNEKVPRDISGQIGFGWDIAEQFFWLTYEEDVDDEDAGE